MAAELCCSVPAVLELRLMVVLCMEGRVRWIQRSGYLITSLLLPSSTPWTGELFKLYILSKVAQEQDNGLLLQLEIAC